MYLLADLLCEEDDSVLYSPFDDTHENLPFCSVSESDFDFIQLQLQKETNFRVGNNENFATGWLKSARLDAIKWILQKMSMFGYCYNTAYLSLIYFDRYLARRITPLPDGDVSFIQNLSAVCLCLAAKMEETYAQSIKDYTVMGYEIDISLFQKRELKVLKKLDWKMISATPFTYLNYFASKFCRDNKAFIIRSAELILAIMEEINVAEHRPSIIAAAAVLAEQDHNFTKTQVENKLDSITSWGSYEKEHAFTCYCIMQQVVVKVKTPKSDIFSNSRPSSVVDGSVSALKGARRRLDLDDRDDQTPAPKTFQSFQS